MRPNLQALRNRAHGGSLNRHSSDSCLVTTIRRAVAEPAPATNGLGNGAGLRALPSPQSNPAAHGDSDILGWALTFLVVALIAGVLGFTTVAGTAMGIAKILFFVFLVLFVLSLVMHLVRGRGVGPGPL